MDLVGRTIGRYRILDEIGRGGMGVVYRAEDVELDRHVAVKVLPEELASDPERLTRFRREPRTLAAVSHPSIVNVFDVQEAEGRLFLVMELVEGRTLDRAIPSQGFPLDRFFRLALPLTDAVSEAHGRGVIHRDLKPSNLILTPEGRIKILDFGLARIFKGSRTGGVQDASTESLTATGKIPGTAAYLAPEQIRGEPADERSDIFSLGIILYMMATGRHPFAGESGEGLGVISAILGEQPPSVTRIRPHHPRQLDRILHGCLEKDPERRFQSAKDVRNELERLEEELENPPEPGPASRRRWLVPAAAGLLLLVGLAVTGAILWGGGEDGAESTRLPHVAVDEFQAFAGDVGPDHLHQGFSRALADRLRGLEGAWVVPPEGDPLPDFLVETDVRQAGDAVNLLVHVEESEGARSLGTHSLEEPLRKPFRLLDRTAESIAETIRGATGRDLRYRPAALPTEDPEAFDLYLQARDRWTEGTARADAERALALVEKALESDPEFAQAHVLAGELHLRAHGEDDEPENLELAAENCSRAVSIDEALARGHLCLARVHRARDRYGEAEVAYVRAIEEDPVLFEAYEDLIGLFGELGMPDRAESTFRRIASRHPRAWAPFWALGRFYSISNRLDTAIEHYKEALRRGERNALVHWHLGAAYFLLGRYEEAILAYQYSIVLRPTFQAHANLGQTYLLLRRYRDAVESFERAVAFERDLCANLGKLALAYALGPDGKEQAQVTFERAASACRSRLQAAPADPNAWLWLSYELSMLGREEESLAALERAFELRPNDPHYFFFAARIRLALGDRERALALLERAVEGGYPLTEVRLSPELDPLRDEPEFRRLLGEQVDGAEAPPDRLSTLERTKRGRT